MNRVFAAEPAAYLYSYCNDEAMDSVLKAFFVAEYEVHAASTIGLALQPPYLAVKQHRWQVVQDARCFFSNLL